MSLGNWYQSEGNPLRHTSKMNATAGAGLYTVDALIPYPAEAIGWNPNTSPFPAALLVPQLLSDKFLLLTDQVAYRNGIYKCPTNAASGPPEFIIDLTDSTTWNQDFVGQRIAVNSPIQSLFGEVVVALNILNNAMYYASVNGASPVIFTAYTSNININSAPLQIDGVTPVTDLTGGTPVPILLTNQTTSSENGFYFATTSNAKRTRLRDRPSSSTDPVVTVFGDDGDIGGTGSWWLNVGGLFVSI